MTIYNPPFQNEQGDYHRAEVTPQETQAVSDPKPIEEPFNLWLWIKDMTIWRKHRRRSH